MAYLLAKDTINGAEGKVFITVDGKNIEVAGMRNIHANADVQSGDMRVIGTSRIQDKPNGAKLTGTGNIYYGTNLFTDMVLAYRVLYSAAFACWGQQAEKGASESSFMDSSAMLQFWYSIVAVRP